MKLSIIEENTKSVLIIYRTSEFVGKNIDQKIIEPNPDGSFSIPLDIDDAVRYRLYLYKQYPIRSNACIHLYLEPGDSIYVNFNESDKETIQFSGRGYRNSKFFNARKIPTNTFSQVPFSFPMLYHDPDRYGKYIIQHDS